MAWHGEWEERRNLTLPTAHRPPSHITPHHQPPPSHPYPFPPTPCSPLAEAAAATALATLFFVNVGLLFPAPLSPLALPLEFPKLLLRLLCPGLLAWKPAW
ncbi:hypothetical protein Q7P37_000581 [Cladosporium fusiforme]